MLVSFPTTVSVSFNGDKGDSVGSDPSSGESVGKLVSSVSSFVPEQAWKLQ